MNVVSDEALMAIESLSIMDMLDSEPTLEDFNQALDQLSSGKALGNDGIPVEVIKCAKGTLLKELHEILCQCWREGEVPQDMRDATVIVTVTLVLVESDYVGIPHVLWNLTSTALAKSLM